MTEVAGTLTCGTPKTHQRRSVPIPRFLVDELDVLKARKGPKDLVFIGARGGVPRNMNFRRDVFDDDLDGLADRLDEARVYSTCTKADGVAKGERAVVSEFRSVSTESA